MTSLADYQWVSSLAHRYCLATENRDPTRFDPDFLEQQPSLQLASATLARLQAHRHHPLHAQHVVIVGPTQSGKSTLVNVLLDTTAAAVSALAGFTVHTQGYAPRVDDVDIAYVEHIMAPSQRIPANTLKSAELAHYVLEEVVTGVHSLTGDAVVWDTPDFDSITASTYSLAVIKSVALADVIILTVSKDKYGDKRVWDMLDLLHAMEIPLLICINKLDETDKALVENAFQSRFEARFGMPAPVLVTLPFIKGDDRQQNIALTDTKRQALQDALHSAISTIEPSTQFARCEAFIRSHEAQWLQPLVTEMDARDQWHTLIRQATTVAEQYYVNSYLDNPDKYETFNRALAELLTLLEIPGVAPTLAQARKIITWPARQLLGIGQQALGKSVKTVRNTSGQILDQEAIVLEHILDNTLIGLQRELLEAPVDHWWQALNAELRTRLPAIRKEYSHASETARKQFEPEIEKAAATLYEQLKKQPALLNTLRAARVSADAAGVALAVKSGGLAPTDLILAPAMLSITTLLTESALGRYLDTVKRELKKRQREHIKHHVLEQVLQASLLDVAKQIDKPDLLGSRLDTHLKSKVDAFRQAQER